MRKHLAAAAAALTALALTACAMSPEEITTYMTSLEASYQNGGYEQALSEVQTLSKSYKKMTDEQKAKFDELKSNVEYASQSAADINSRLDSAQSMLDQQQYYEANQELDGLASAYTLPPAEQKKYDEKKAAADTGIKVSNNTAVLQNAQTLLNSGNYTAASDELGKIDSSVLSAEQNQEYQSLLGKISKAKADAEAAAKAKAAAAAAKAKAEAEQKEKNEAELEYYDGEYHYNGKAVGKGTLKSYMNGDITKEQFEKEMSEYNP